MEESFLSVGDRVRHPKKGWGEVVYIGPHAVRKGIWVGVVLEEALGSHNGTVTGHTYFKCNRNHGALFPIAMSNEGRWKTQTAGSVNEMPDGNGSIKWHQKETMLTKDLKDNNEDKYTHVLALVLNNSEYQFLLSYVHEFYGASIEVTPDCYDANLRTIVHRANSFAIPDPPSIDSVSRQQHTTNPKQDQVYVLFPTRDMHNEHNIYVPGAVVRYSKKRRAFVVRPLLGETRNNEDEKGFNSSIMEHAALEMSTTSYSNSEVPGDVFVPAAQLVRITEDEATHIVSLLSLRSFSQYPRLSSTDSQEQTVVVLMNGVANKNMGREFIKLAASSYRIVLDRVCKVTPNGAKKFFSSLIGPARNTLVKNLTSTPCLVALVEGLDAVRQMHMLVSQVATLPQCDKFSQLIHCSLSAEEASKEFDFFFKSQDVQERLHPFSVNSESSYLSSDISIDSTGITKQVALQQSLDDGWFYPVYVRDCLSYNLFVTKTQDDRCSLVSGSSLILQENWIVPKAGEYVLAEYPGDVLRFAPGELLEIGSKKQDIPSVIVRFYNGLTIEVAYENCTSLNPMLYDYTQMVEQIKGIEKSHIGQTVICRRNDWLYFRGTIVSKAYPDFNHSDKTSTPSVRYKVKFEDGEEETQHQEFMSIVPKASEDDACLTTHELARGDKVLAVYFEGQKSKEEYSFDVLGPAIVKSSDMKKATVTFWDMHEQTVDFEAVTPISDKAYSQAISYLAAVNV
eukprot:m.2638 g.2638  ORF g.2638 m.2638 type:complete len:736 (-) comp2559_c0_seq1:163-2370(-)